MEGGHVGSFDICGYLKRQIKAILAAVCLVVPSLVRAEGVDRTRISD